MTENNLEAVAETTDITRSPNIASLENTLRTTALTHAFRNYLITFHVPLEGEHILIFLDMLCQLIHLRTFPRGETYAEERLALLAVQDKYLTCPTYWILHALNDSVVSTLHESITAIRFCEHENPRKVNILPMCILLDRALHAKHELWKVHVDWMITQIRTAMTS